MMTSAPRWDTAQQRTDEAIELVTLDDARGVAVRALKGFPKGSIIHRFAGVVSSEICQHSLQIGPGRHISGTRYIGYLSHGCDPNCRLVMADFAVVALADIAAGSVLTIDYAETEQVLHKQFACLCDAVECRGWITGSAEGPNAEGLAWRTDDDAR